MKNYIYVCVVSLILGFGIARYTTPKEVITQVKTITIEKQVETKVVSKNNKKTKITEAVDGSKVTEIEEESNETKDIKSNSNIAKKDENTHSIFGSSRNNFSALLGARAGLSPLNLASPVFGAAFNTTLLGPITGGVWALSNTSFNNVLVGVSLGVNY